MFTKQTIALVAAAAVVGQVEAAGTTQVMETMFHAGDCASDVISTTAFVPGVCYGTNGVYLQVTDCAGKKASQYSEAGCKGTATEIDGSGCLVLPVGDLLVNMTATCADVASDTLFKTTVYTGSADCNATASASVNEVVLIEDTCFTQMKVSATDAGNVTLGIYVQPGCPSDPFMTIDGNLGVCIPTSAASSIMITQLGAASSVALGALAAAAAAIAAVVNSA